MILSFTTEFGSLRSRSKKPKPTVSVTLLGNIYSPSAPITGTSSTFLFEPTIKPPSDMKRADVPPVLQRGAVPVLAVEPNEAPPTTPCPKAPARAPTTVPKIPIPPLPAFPPEAFPASGNIQLIIMLTNFLTIVSCTILAMVWMML